ncbi:hypothetical protein B0H17DRAFT_139275 [Mycena rosella]|uniref:SET domain-containing protein n=1 Tax=Mycena rosella TaxID=1033263 RepID=A0AAD7GQ02_MYCRO|nr:hypothetical protein B0H17DRAFT_139275 [Mycena rosella]
MEDYEEEFVRNLKAAQAVYCSVRDEFYAWKGRHIAELSSRIFPSEAATGSDVAAGARFRIPTAAFDPPPNASGQTEAEPCIYTWEYDADGRITAPGERIPLVVLEPDQFIAHPPYQFCTPASRNLTARMIDNAQAPFVPYPEESAFPHKRYLASFDGFQWENDQRDPDDEVIQYETVRRLHVERGFPAETIDDIMRDHSSFRRLRLSNESGLLWDVSQRDPLKVIWGDGRLASSKPHLPPHFAQEFPTSNDIFIQINSGLTKFCPNLNCIMHCCQIHITHDWSLYTPALTPKEPHLTSAEFFEQPGATCGDNCFRLIDPDDMEDQDMSIDNLDFLQSALKLDPDMLPCDLAVICKLPCRHVFFHRRDLVDDREVFPPAPVIETKKKRKGKRPQRLSLYRKADTKKRRPFSRQDFHLPPCSHPGPCSQVLMGCQCFKANSLCERNCRCPPTCPRRWTGCNSTCARSPTCGRKCRCRMAGRECDPELCTACDARDTHVHFPDIIRRSTRCENMEIQRSEFKCFHIKRSTWGLGAFAAEPISTGDVIGEYVGELLDGADQILGHRDTIQKYSGLNYCFGITDRTTVDAQWLGNPTRFLNDSKPHRPNCGADGVHTANGEPRLIIRALKPIKEGNELTLDYGKVYWAAHV